MRFFAILIAAFIMFTSGAFAADPPMPAPLQTLAKEGAAIRYLGKENGLDGWVTIKNGQEQFFYVTEDQQAIVMGVLFNNKGDIVTMRQVQALRKNDPAIDAIANKLETPPTAESSAATVAPQETPAPVAGKAAQLFTAVENSNWVALGQKTAPVIYSFIDPQCPHCHDMIQDIRKSGDLEKGLIQLRLVPVGLMNEKSLKQAANLLAATNAQDALYKHLDGDPNALLGNDDPNTQGIQRNMVLMQDWKLDVTPFSIYKNKKGEIKILRGRPNDLKTLIADLNK